MYFITLHMFLNSVTMMQGDYFSQKGYLDFREIKESEIVS
jgi:hypothetical protein